MGQISDALRAERPRASLSLLGGIVKTGCLYFLYSLADYDGAECVANNSEHPGRVLAAVKEVLSDEADPNGNLRLAGEVGGEAATALKLLAGFRDGINYVLSG